MPLRIGIDFDNTIACYDRLFAGLAAEMGVVATAKQAVRDAVRALPRGETRWREMQALAYGPRMGEATLFAGFTDFVRAAKGQGATLYIVSHKTERSNLTNAGPSFRTAARDWMTGLGFFSVMGFARNAVFFESTREEKVARIATLKLTHFIDDLPEVFAEPAFPAATTAVAFGGGPEDWPALAAHLFPQAAREFAA